jgi:hypothetical protein
VAHWIYESQTACHAKCRRKAIKKLGKYDCICNPEIMCAFIYGLNDCDERVRKESAVQIRKQVKKNCCCNDKVVCALTYALGDCDKGVVRAACRALKACGYDVQNSCCTTTVASTCCPQPASCGAPVTAPVPAPVDKAPETAPVPTASEPGEYFPSKLKGQQTNARKSGLSNLFGSRN